MQRPAGHPPRGAAQNMHKVGTKLIVQTCAALVVSVAGARHCIEAQRSEHDGSIFERQYSCTAKDPEGSLRTEDLTVLGFTIGTSTIRDVQKRFPGTHPVKLAHEEEAEEGICVKNKEGMAVVFATSVMGAPHDTLVAIYFAPVGLVDGPRLECQSVTLPSKMFSSASGIRVGATSAQLASTVRGKIPTDGPFCTAYLIASSRGPLQHSNEDKAAGHDFTGAEGDTRAGKLEWVKLFGIASD